MLEHLFRYIDLYLPKSCLCCGFNCDSYTGICSYCKNWLPWLKNRCVRCAGNLNSSTQSKICETCEDSPPLFANLHALFSYEPPLNMLINRLKFQHDLYPSKLFADLFVEQVTRQWYNKQQLPDVLIPVPLHITRQRERGYNQAQQICQQIAKKLHIPMHDDLCSRITATLPQARLSKEQRHNNVRDVFAIQRNITAYEHIAIFDDVVTTGATVNSFCKALFTAGAKYIEVWAVCRG